MNTATVTLEALAAQPAVARTLTAEARAAALTQCAAVLAALAALPGGQHKPARRDDAAGLEVLTTKALARLWRMPESKIRDLCRTGALPARKLGSKEWVISAAALRDWLPGAGVAGQCSPGLQLLHEPERSPRPPQATRPYAVEVRRPAGRAPSHDRGLGGGGQVDERHDGAPAPSPRAAGRAGARTAAAASADDSPTTEGLR